MAAPGGGAGGGRGGLPPPLTAGSTVEDRSPGAAGGGGAVAAGPVPLPGGGVGDFTFPRLAAPGGPGVGGAVSGGAAGGTGRARRAKVRTGPGFSQVAWLREARALEHSRPPPRRDLTWEEVRTHAAPGDCWTVLRGRVYALSPYFRYHPGGERILDQGCGRDCTRLFQKYHAWVNERLLIGSLLVGELKVEERLAAAEGGGGGQGGVASREELSV